MLIRIGYDIELAVATPMALIYLLRVHPSRRDDLVAPESVQVSGGLVPEEYIDSFGNHCGRVNVPVGMSTVRITNDALIRDSGQLDEVNPEARQHDRRVDPRSGPPRRGKPGAAPARSDRAPVLPPPVPAAEPLLRGRQRVA